MILVISNRETPQSSTRSNGAPSSSSSSSEAGRGGDRYEPSSSQSDAGIYNRYSGQGDRGCGTYVNVWGETAQAY